MEKTDIRFDINTPQNFNVKDAYTIRFKTKMISYKYKFLAGKLSRGYNFKLQEGNILLSEL